MRQAVEAARMGWGLCTVCGVAGNGETLDIVPRLLITGRRVCGSSFGGLKGREDVPALMRHWSGEIDVEPFISHRMSLDDVNRGFELMEAQDGIRCVSSSEPWSDGSAGGSRGVLSFWIWGWRGWGPRDHGRGEELRDEHGPAPPGRGWRGAWMFGRAAERSPALLLRAR